MARLAVFLSVNQIMCKVNLSFQNDFLTKYFLQETDEVFLSDH